jgi:hypothetical protein
MREVAAALVPQPMTRTGLTAAPALARAYETIFNAQFDQVPARLDEACGPRGPRVVSPDAATGLAPREACLVLELESLWWQIQLDAVNTAHDEAFRAKATAAIAAADAWTLREPRRAEAWFYLGGAYGARVQFLVTRGEPLAAARDGKRVNDALEHALRLDPEFHDAFFGIGLYHYYADVAPPAARLLRRLLLLPGGDKARGLREIAHARDRGRLVRSEADYQLHLLDLWYERRPEHALELMRDLRTRHPRNPHFAQRIAEIEDVYLGDLTGSLRSWESLLDAARERRVAEPDMAEARARLGLALQLDRLYETDLALDHLRILIRDTPAAPHGVMAQAHLQLAQGLDRLGLRAEAVTAYRAAGAATPEGDPLKTAARARIGLRDSPPAAVARAYRLSIEGWRAFERGSVNEAARAIGESLTLAPSDLVTRYRYARVLLAQKNETAALAVLETIVAAGTTNPPSFYASSCVEAAQIYEQRGDVARAIETHRLAVAAFGVDRRVKEHAQRALTRLGASAAIAQAAHGRGSARAARARGARAADDSLLFARARTET